MYSTCIFCHQPLGANEAVEHFPVGRRLAFDAARGRLWVVCRGCGRWNLSPLEERWEAVEACERLYRETRLRVSTENIGLARLAEGLELVRIGQPQRPELAAWRYGDQFGRRRRRQVLASAAGFVVAMGAIYGGPAVGLWSASAVASASYAAQGLNLFHQKLRAAVRLPRPDRGSVSVTHHLLRQVQLFRDYEHEGAWQLAVPYSASVAESVSIGVRSFLWGLRANALGRVDGAPPPAEPVLRLRGPEAIRAAALMLPKLNPYGGSRRQVREAVGLLDEAGSPERVFAAAAGMRSARRGRWATHALGALPPGIRLALEMAAHEDTERRALEGELALLEREWREAEEIAAIADTLTLPARVEEFIRRHRGG